MDDVAENERLEEVVGRTGTATLTNATTGKEMTVEPPSEPPYHCNTAAKHLTNEFSLH